MRKLFVAGVVLLALWAWRAELFHVSRPVVPLRPLALRTPTERWEARVDAVLPQIPVGLRRIVSGRAVVLIHYWAPWEFAGRSQAIALDSLRREPGLEELEVVLVSFDPFPSVARFVARHRLRLSVVLDHEHRLSRMLPCPSLPYTYVLDRSGNIAVAQAGDVDWLTPGTLEALRQVLREPAVPAGAPL